MFGLMRAKGCGMTAEEKTFRRLNYCGTCKTIGSLYSGRARLLLNHDAVFLAEILTSLGAGTPPPEGWGKAYLSYNCLDLPREEQQMPVALRYAATTNVVLTAFKLEDHVADEKKRRFLFAQKAFSKDFQKAEKRLKEWGFPLGQVRAILQTQGPREQIGGGGDSSLDYLAEPTARATAEFFAFGAGLVGKSESRETAREIGFAFGKLVYVLDALEDYERDFRGGRFNALAAVCRLKEEALPAETRRRTAALLRGLEGDIARRIYALPIAENQKKLFVLRLRSNLEKKLKPELPVLKTGRICRPGTKQAWAQRRRNASATAKDLAKNYSWLATPLVFLFVFAFALAAPAQSREAKSARECFDLSFNLMFLGALFGSIISFPRSVLMENPEEVLTKKGRRKKMAQAAMAEREKQESSWCDWCDCDCCDCCGGDEGCCGNCDCCSGCCDNCCCCDCNCD